MNVEIYTQPFNRALGDLYVKDYIEVFPLQKEDVSLNCIECFRKAYSKLVWYLKKTDMKKFIFSGDPKKIYNFPSIGCELISNYVLIFGSTTATARNPYFKGFLAVFRIFFLRVELNPDI